jgi:alpha-tubulin suppressor-like RCC1 family protein
MKQVFSRSSGEIAIQKVRSCAFCLGYTWALYFGFVAGSALQAQTAGGFVVGWGCYAGACTNDIVAIASGYSHSLLLRRDSVPVACGSYAPHGDPVRLPSGLSNIVAISASGATCFLVDKDGLVTRWGPNADPMELPPTLTNVVALSTGIGENAALRADGSLVYWGDRDSSPPPDATNIVAVACGFGTLAVKADGTVIAWGGPPGWSETVRDLTNVVSVSVGNEEWLALKADGTVVNHDMYPVPAGLSNVQAIAASPGNDIHLDTVLKSDGTVLYWGWNFCGAGPTEPTELNASGVVAISSGWGAISPGGRWRAILNIITGGPGRHSKWKRVLSDRSQR